MLKKDASEVLQRLKKAYPEAACALLHENALQLLVATILSAQCTDKRVNMVTPALFRRYKTAEDFAKADISELENYLRSTNFYRNKAKNIKAAAAKIVRDFQGEVPDKMEDLLTLDGVARKTANVVLGVWYKINTGVVVDTHVSRVSQLLGLTFAKTPPKIELDLMKTIPQDDWEYFSLAMIQLGRQICIARRPKCEECFLNDLCPSAFKINRTLPMVQKRKTEKPKKLGLQRSKKQGA